MHHARRRSLDPASAIGLAIALVVIAWLYLWPALSGEMRTPGGYDTPKYMWRATLVQERGLRALSDPSVARLTPLAERAAFPTLASFADGVAGVPVLRFMYVLPALAAVAIGLAAGAFALAGLNEPGWSAGVYALAVGASVTVARTVIGYADQTLIDPILMAAALAAVLTAARDGPIAAATVLLIAAFVTHWIFAATFTGVLVGFAVLLIPLSFIRRRAGDGYADLPSVRIGAVLAGAGVGVGGLFLLGGMGELHLARPLASTLADKFHRFTALFRLPWFLPTAALGAVAAWFGLDRDTPRRRLAAILTIVWAGLGVGGLVAYGVLDIQVPAYRLLLAALGLPILVATALTGVARLIGRWLGRIGIVLGVAVAIAGAAAMAVGGWRVWRDRTPSFTPEQAAQAAVVGRYLQANPGPPAILVVTGQGLGKQDRIIRSMLPADQISRPWLFIGSVEDLLAGHPTVRRRANITQASAESFPAVQPLLGRDPIVLALSGFARPLDRTLPGIAIGPGVTLVRGPPPAAPISATVELWPGAGRIVADLALVLLLVWLAGLGWAWRNLPGQPVAALAVAPAVGIGVLCAVGVVLGLLGLNLAGVWGILVVLATALLGWLRLPSRRGRHEEAAKEAKEVEEDAVEGAEETEAVEDSAVDEE